MPILETLLNMIGYLPAEHIETPTERLARLNKHRNLDVCFDAPLRSCDRLMMLFSIQLSQTMLTDQEDDRKVNPLNPLKKAMRRRNVKTVQFAPPTYVEPSDYGASSDEDEEGGEETTLVGDDASEVQIQEQSRNGIDGAAVVEPLATRDVQINGRNNGNDLTDRESQERTREQISSSELSRTSDEGFDRTEDGTASKSRKGTVRNTDSFFKDDGVETRKINLTPSLLRDDSISNFSKSSENTVRTTYSTTFLDTDIFDSSETDRVLILLRKMLPRRRARTRRRKRRREVCLVECSSVKIKRTRRARRKRWTTERRHRAKCPDCHRSPKSPWNRCQMKLQKPTLSHIGRLASSRRHHR